jgi:hypothetical protein
VTAWLTEDEYARLRAACDRMVPASESHPGAVAAGVPDYIDQLLGAFSFDPPRIWAGGPSSGRMGGEAAFASFHRLSALDELAWRMRIEGSKGLPEREFNGPVAGWQECYRAGLAALGPDFTQLDADEQDARLRADHGFAKLLHQHVCEGLYGAPEYGGNQGCAGWEAIGFDGDVQPRGWTDEEVANP